MRLSGVKRDGGGGTKEGGRGGVDVIRWRRRRGCQRGSPLLCLLSRIRNASRSPLLSDVPSPCICDSHSGDHRPLMRFSTHDDAAAETVGSRSDGGSGRSRWSAILYKTATRTHLAKTLLRGMGCGDRW